MENYVLSFDGFKNVAILLADLQLCLYCIRSVEISSIIYDKANVPSKIETVGGELLTC